MSISMTDARKIYITYLQQRIQLTAPGMRNNPVKVAYDFELGRDREFSWPELLTNAQRNTQTGINETILYARAMGYAVVG